MAKFQGGLEEMVKALQLMMPGARKKLLGNIAKKDPQMAQLIEKRLVTLEQLRYISSKMLVDFLKEVPLKDLAMALKIHSPELMNSIKEKVSSSMAKEIDEIVIHSKMKLSDVELASSRVSDKLRELVEQEKIILSKEDNYV